MHGNAQRCAFPISDAAAASALPLSLIVDRLIGIHPLLSPSALPGVESQRVIRVSVAWPKAEIQRCYLPPHLRGRCGTVAIWTRHLENEEFKRIHHYGSIAVFTCPTSSLLDVKINCKMNAWLLTSIVCCNFVAFYHINSYFRSPWARVRAASARMHARCPPAPNGAFFASFPRNNGLALPCGGSVNPTGY